MKISCALAFVNFSLENEEICRLVSINLISSIKEIVYQHK